MSDWPSEEPTVPGGPPPDEAETVVQPTRPGGRPPEPPPPEEPPPEEGERELWPWLLGLLVLVIAGILLAYFLTRGGGHSTKPVPNVVGETQTAATTRLRDAGFQVTPRNTHSTQPTGVVVTQKPAADSELAKGGAVTIAVSQGQKQVAVPNVLGLPQSQAVADLKNAGLNTNIVLVTNAAPSGRVVAQNPSSGTTVNTGTTVRMNVSKGRAQTTTVTKTVTRTQTQTHVTTETTPTTTHVITTTTVVTTTTTTP